MNVIPLTVVIVLALGGGVAFQCMASSRFHKGRKALQEVDEKALSAETKLLCGWIWHNSAQYATARQIQTFARIIFACVALAAVSVYYF